MQRYRNLFFWATTTLFACTACGRNTGEAPANPRPETPMRSLDADEYADQGLIGNSLPGSWRPFADDSPWNTPISEEARSHPQSDAIVFTLAQDRDHISLINAYLTPIWVVNSSNIDGIRVRSDNIFDRWDRDEDGWTDVLVPVTRRMYPEPTGDGQLCIVDPFKHRLWDISTFDWPEERPFPTGTTFDVWDLTSSGVADPPPGTHWTRRGGRGSGFPGIAGIIRPEEVETGEIRHAVCFTSRMVRQHASGANIFLPPACRSDGRDIGTQFPIMGMRFQLNPELTEKDFDEWGLNRAGKVLARALQRYGMFLGVSGGAMKLQVQLLGATPEANRREWERRLPGFYDNVKRIPTREFRILDTGDPVLRSN